jgi:hypothetical protein
MQYGVSSTAFGVWRELAAQVMTTDWVPADGCESFPLMYHWRALPSAPVGVSPAAIVTRYAPVTMHVNDFYWQLFGDDRTVPSPADELRQAWAATGLAA